MQFTCVTSRSEYSEISSVRRLGINMLPFVVVALALSMCISYVKGDPLPAVDFASCKNDVAGCCVGLPVPNNGSKYRFKFQSELPMRERKAAHLVDEAYIAKIQKAYALMRALPDTDGRSFISQKQLHCAYCDSSLSVPGTPYNFEIHNSWLFFPFHRWYLYFHERILAKLLGDDTFALPFWNWDDQSSEPPLANIFPYLYANETFGPNKNASSLWDPTRQACNQPPTIVSFNPAPPTFCSNHTADAQRLQNEHLLYTQLVAGSTTPTLWFGQPYRYGMVGAVGGSLIEVTPHGFMHPWLNVVKGPFAVAAGEPMFYPHHGNVDRIWELWKKIPGGTRKDLTDPDWLNTELTFYDEDGNLVAARVGDALDIEKLRYKYQKVRKPTWASREYGKSIPKCNLMSNTQINDMIEKAPVLNENGVTLFEDPLVFKVKRPIDKSRHHGKEEVLVLNGMHYNWTEPSGANFDVYIYLPANLTTPAGLVSCAEWVGMFSEVGHPGLYPVTPEQLYRVAIGQKLRDMDRDDLSEVVVTLVQRYIPSIIPAQHIFFHNATITYFDS